MKLRLLDADGLGGGREDSERGLEGGGVAHYWVVGVGAGEEEECVRLSLKTSS